MFRNTLSGRPPGRPLCGHVKLFFCLSNDCDSSSIRAIFSHTNITGRAIPTYRSDYLPTISFSLSHTEIENFETQNRAKVTQVVLTERSHCAVEFSSGLTAAVLRDLDEHGH